MHLKMFENNLFVLFTYFYLKYIFLIKQNKKLIRRISNLIITLSSFTFTIQ